jgi:cytochrome c oxidase subunit 2
MTDTKASEESKELTDRDHLRRIGLIWLVLTLVCLPLVIFVLGPHLPPGTDSHQAMDQQEDNIVLAAVATPVLLFIWVYIGYAVKNWRIPADTPIEEIQDGPPIRGHRGFQTAWIAITSVTVFALFVYGTSELWTDNGAGTGSGSSPVWTPAGYSTNIKDSKLLVVQVIGQQWRWTYRFPQYGGVETDTLVIPAGKTVQFDVTSLDVIHSFWAINLGVKADANPGNNNIAFVENPSIGPVDIRCAELCGTYHGAMAQTGQVESQADFATWIGRQVLLHYDLLPQLPAYADFYIPQTDGGYYDPSQVTPPAVDSGLPPPPPEPADSSAAPSPAPSST